MNRIEFDVEEMYKEDFIANDLDKEYDCALVRATEVFPVEKVIQSLQNDNVYYLKQSDLFNSVIEKN